MNDLHGAVGHSACDREPIQFIGRIQSFGWLISFSSDWIVNHASANCDELFGRHPRDMIGLPATQFLSPTAIHDIRTRLQVLGGAVERIFEVDLIGDGRLFDLALHASGRSLVLDIEPHETGKRRDYVSYVRPMIERMRQSDSIEQLCISAARHLRALTGFDRVMIYRFGRDGAGEVVGESLNGMVASFNGLRFPVSDIPAQARQLYTRNLLRIISDVDDPTVAVEPAVNSDGEALDLSMSGLRAVSPIHIEYLRNMGVKASMSVSIMRRGSLWGLMTCHHCSPRRLSYSIRTASELFGEFFAYLLEQREADDAVARKEKTTRLHNQITARVAAGGSLLEAFEDLGESISSVIPFDGIIGWVDGRFASLGSTPTEAQFSHLARFLSTTGTNTTWSTDAIAALFEPAREWSDRAAGVLTLPVSRTPRDYIVLFRREHLHQVNWAGNPEKLLEMASDGLRLSPRKSFEIWKEERRGHSRPWSDDENQAAEALRATLLEAVLRLCDAANLERDQASRRQDVLIAELNHRVRNILNLIRGLVSQSKDSANTIDDFAQIVGSRIHALARAHDQVTQTDWAPSSLYNLIRTETAAYTAQSAARVLIDGPDAMIAPTAFNTLALVFHELMTNSVKYGALSNADGAVSVTLDYSEDGALNIAWTETGGPAVKPPSRRGFGSTIIERTIPHELGGTATVTFLHTGVHAHFRLPSVHVASFGPPSMNPSEMRPDLANDADFSHAIGPGAALVVEDNVIIAMEAEDLLQNLGFQDCRVAGTVRDALAQLESGEIAFAMLDVNLGKETSELVAQTLSERAIPFIFASGYGEGTALDGRFAHIPVVTKPYGEHDVRAALQRLPQSSG